MFSLFVPADPATCKHSWDSFAGLCRWCGSELPLFLDDPPLVTPLAPKCDCGAQAIGAKDYTPAHSRWCSVAVRP